MKGGLTRRNKRPTEDGKKGRERGQRGKGRITRVVCKEAFGRKRSCCPGGRSGRGRLAVKKARSCREVFSWPSSALKFQREKNQKGVGLAISYGKRKFWGALNSRKPTAWGRNNMFAINNFINF